MKKILLIFAVLFITTISYSQSYTTGKLKADTVKSRDGERLTIGAGDTTNIYGTFLINGSAISAGGGASVNITGDTSLYGGSFNISDPRLTTEDKPQDTHGDITFYGENEFKTDIAVDGNIITTGSISGGIGIIAEGDTTPDVSGANIWKYAVDANEGIELSNLVNAVIGTEYTIIGGGTSYISILDEGNFNLDKDVELYKNDVIKFVCLAKDWFVQTSPIQRNNKTDTLNYDYYVTTRGNDSNGGKNLYDAFLTLSAAQSAATTGDRIYVDEGEYNMTTLTLSKALEWNGYGAVLTDDVSTTSYFLITSVDEIILKGFTIYSINATVSSFYVGNYKLHKIIDCNFYTGGGANANYSISSGATSTDSISLINCHISAGSDGHLQLYSGAYFEGCVFDSTSTYVTYALNTGNHNITYKECEFNWTSGYVLYHRHNGDFAFDDCEFTLPSGTPNTLLLGGSGTISGKRLFITDCDFDVDIALSGVGLIYSNTSSTTSMDSIIVDNCTFDFAASVAGYAIAGSTGVLFSAINNTCTFNGLTGSSAFFFPTGNSLSNYEIYCAGNIIHSKSVSGYSIIIGEDTYDVATVNTMSGIVERNQVFGHYYYYPTNPATAQHGLMSGHQQGISFRNNYVNGCIFGVAIKHKGVSTQDSVIAYNVIENCDEGLRTKGSNGAKFYNNTVVVNCAATGIVEYAISETPNGVGENTLNSVYKNNLIYVETGYEATVVNSGASQSVGDVFDNNLYYHEDGTIDFLLTGTAYASFALWQSGASQDANGLNTDPLFVDYTNGNYRLKYTSPAFNAGENVGINLGISRTFILGTKIYSTQQGSGKTIGSIIN